MSEAVNNSVLKMENITMQFGGVVAINNLSLEVNQGEIVALIGPNGAGKTTAFNCITGVYEPTNGMVYFHGKPIVVNHPQGKMIKQYGGINGDLYKDKKPVVHTPDKITHMGIARTFQNIRLFKSQTAFENVLIGTHLRRTSNMLTATFRINAKEEKANREKAYRLLEIVGLADVANELATSLPYGKQRRLEIARALATDPTLLLLDELIKPVSLSLRLFGNIFGEEAVTEQFYEILPIGAPLVMMALSLLFCALQAIVYTTLVSIYLDEATETNEEE